MITVAYISGETDFFHPFEMYPVDEHVTLLVCRCRSLRRIKRRLRKAQVCGYIGSKMPFDLTHYDGSRIFPIKIPVIINKLAKMSVDGFHSVAVVSSDTRDMTVRFFEDIARLFSDFYVVSPDYSFACDRAEEIMSELGIAVQTEPPCGECDVEIIFGSLCLGLGRQVINYETPYLVKHGYPVPSGVDSQAFAEALYLNGIISEKELRSMPVTVGDSAVRE